MTTRTPTHPPRVGPDAARADRAATRPPDHQVIAVAVALAAVVALAVLAVVAVVTSDRQPLLDLGELAPAALTADAEGVTA